MKVMVIVKATKDSEAGVLPSEQLLHDMGQYNEELVKSGIMLAGEGLHPSSAGARIRFSGKNRTVVNGPFAETKELIAGFWLWQVKSMEEAIEWVKRCPNPMNEDSDIEIRRVYAAEDFAPVDPTGGHRAHEDKLREMSDGSALAAPRFENGREMLVAGYSRTFNDQTRGSIMKLWMKFVPQLGRVPTQVGKDTYGVIYNGDEDHSFDYMTAVEVKDSSNLPSGFTQLRLAPQRYAVFAHEKHVSKISEAMDAICGTWLPKSGHKAAEAPAFEKYTEKFDPQTGSGGIELWIPIKA